MSEYFEALSRLNAPERTPGVDIPRSLYMIPRRDTAYHANRIMTETLNTPLPKYSIPQLFVISLYDDTDVFEFELDKQFTTAQGGRKSIAIRRINFQFDKFEEFVLKQRQFKIRVEQVYVLGGSTINGDYTFQIAASLNEIGSDILDHFKGDTYKAYLAKLLGIEITSITYTDLWDDIYRITITPKNEVDLMVTAMKFTITYDGTDDISRFIPDLGITYIDRGDITKFDNTYEIDMSNTYYPTLENVFTCSSLNPWSPKNIIGWINSSFQNLNRIFPYDNQPMFKLWFDDSRGDRMPVNGLVYGWIELELIIDNENTFAIDE